MKLNGFEILDDLTATVSGITLLMCECVRACVCVCVCVCECGVCVCVCVFVVYSYINLYGTQKAISKVTIQELENTIHIIRQRR